MNLKLNTYHLTAPESFSTVWCKLEIYMPTMSVIRICECPPMLNRPSTAAEHEGGMSDLRGWVHCLAVVAARH